MNPNTAASPRRRPRLITLKQVCEWLASQGPAPSYHTVFRWYREGQKGVFLRVRRMGGAVLTTRQWVRDFFADVEAVKASPRAKRAADVSAEPVPQTSSATARRAKRAAAKCKAMGIA